MFGNLKPVPTEAHFFQLATFGGQMGIFGVVASHRNANPEAWGRDLEF